MRPGNVLSALDALGIEYIVRDNEAHARCPYHEDRKPSWSCNLDTGMHNCFSCGFGGSFPKLVAFLNGGSRRDAETWCRSFVPDLDEERERAGKRKQAAREITDAHMFRFYPPPDRALEDKHLTKGGAEIYGILYDHDEDMWVTPVRDPETRKLRGWQEKSKHHFKNYPLNLIKKDCLFGAHLLYPGCRAVIVESPLDAPLFWQDGLAIGVATYGASWSTEQMRLIWTVTDDVIEAFDNDDAGARAADKLYGQTWRGDLRSFNYNHARAKDPGEMTYAQRKFGVQNATR